MHRVLLNKNNKKKDQEKICVSRLLAIGDRASTCSPYYMMKFSSMHCTIAEQDCLDLEKYCTISLDQVVRMWDSFVIRAVKKKRKKSKNILSTVVGMAKILAGQWTLAAYNSSYTSYQCSCTRNSHLLNLMMSIQMLFQSFYNFTG